MRNRKALPSLLLVAAGGAIAAFSVYLWRLDPTRKFHAINATVIEHDVTFDHSRWHENQSRAMRLATKVLIPLTAEAAPRDSELRLEEFFSDGESAWKVAQAYGAGSTMPCLISQNLREGRRVDHVASGPTIAMILGSLMLLIGVVRLTPWGLVWVEASFGVGLFGIFLVVGVVAAWSLWPAALRHVQAANWKSTSYELIGQRTLGSGKSRTHQTAIRYVVEGKCYETVLPNNDFGLGSLVTTPHQCMVHPTRPWQVVLSWGWRPGLGVPVLFPVPFLCVGLLTFLVAIGSLPKVLSRLGAIMPNGLSPSELRTAGLQDDVLSAGFKLLVVGSLIGVFVCACAELWIQKQDGKWIFTIILIPFVLAAMSLAKAFAVAVWRLRMKRD